MFIIQKKARSANEKGKKQLGSQRSAADQPAAADGVRAVADGGAADQLGQLRADGAADADRAPAAGHAAAAVRGGVEPAHPRRLRAVLRRLRPVPPRARGPDPRRQRALLRPARPDAARPPDRHPQAHHGHARVQRPHARRRPGSLHEYPSALGE